MFVFSFKKKEKKQNFNREGDFSFFCKQTSLFHYIGHTALKGVSRKISRRGGPTEKKNLKLAKNIEK